MKEIKYPNLIGEMARHGETQKTLAKLVGMTSATICRRFAGTTQWTIDEVDKICEHYGKDYYELFKTNIEK